MYTVIVNGIPVQCEDAADAIELARQAAGNGGGGGEPTTTPKNRTHHDVAGTPGSRRTEQRIKEFYALIQGNQKKVVDTLLEAVDGRTDVQLQQLVGFDNNMALAGVFTGLYKNAKRVGANPDELYKREAVMIGDSRRHEYRLVDSFRTAAKKWKP